MTKTPRSLVDTDKTESYHVSSQQGTWMQVGRMQRLQGCGTAVTLESLVRGPYPIEPATM